MGAAALLYTIFCTDQLGTRTAAGGFAPDRAAAFFQHRLSGGHERRQRVRPFRAAAFSAPAEWGTRTALACSPLTGGKFFAEPQRGGFAVCGRQETSRHPPRGQKEGHLRFPFLFELLPFPYLLARRNRRRRPLRKGNDRGFFLPCLSKPVRRVR